MLSGTLQTHGSGENKMDGEILKVQNLIARFYTYAGVVKALEGINFSIRKNETFGIVGETGCGKSVTALSILNLIPSPGKIESGEILLKRNDSFDDLTKLDEEGLRQIRGKDISMIFQEPSEALNPVYTIGDQIAEALLAHQEKRMIRRAKKKVEKEIKNSNSLKKPILKIEKRLYEKMAKNPESLSLKILSRLPIVKRYNNRVEEEAKKRAVQVLESVGIPEAKEVAKKYPYEMSGGMNQRAVISMALACKPRLLIADEPTSNLDVSIQARILELLNDLKEEYGLSILYITHDLGVVAQTCDRVGVMYAGRIVEIAEVEELFNNPQHPYTKLLLRAVPSPQKDRLEVIEGSVPDLIEPPEGCRFNPRCPVSDAKCSEEHPNLMKVKENHYVACPKRQAGD